MTRYERQLCLPEVGAQGQALLSQAVVLVVGAGGLGSAVLPLLAGAGCGRILIVDPDRVEVGNLHRQTLYRMSDIGHPKARRAARSLRDLNPDCEVHADVARLDPAVARQLVPQASVVVDAADSFAVTYALSDTCLASGIPLISASALGRTGYVGGFCGGAPSYRAVFPDLPLQSQTCATAGVMGPVVSMLGTMQAQMVLSVLLGHDPNPLGQIMTADMVGWRVSSFRFDTALEPENAFPIVIAGSQIKDTDLVIDLRLAQPPKLGAGELSPSQRVVFVCATGLRAWRAARDLGAQGHPAVAIVGDGG